MEAHSIPGLVKQKSYVTRDTTPIETTEPVAEKSVAKESKSVESPILATHPLPNGKVAIGYQDGSIGFWNPETNSTTKLEQKEYAPTCSAAFFALDKGNALYFLRKKSLTSESIIQKWNLQTETCEWSKSLPTDIAKIKCIKVINSILYAKIPPNDLFIYDLQIFQTLFHDQLSKKSLFSSYNCVTALGETDDHQLILGTLKGIELHQPGSAISSRAMVKKIVAEGLNGDGQIIISLTTLSQSRVAAALQNGAIWIIDPKNKKHLGTLHNEAATKQSHSEQQSVVYLPADNGDEYLAQIINYHDLILWDIKSGKCVEGKNFPFLRLCCVLANGKIAGINESNHIATYIINFAHVRQEIEAAPPLSAYKASRANKLAAACFT